MKHSLKPLAACMAALFGTASFNALAAPPAPPPVQNQTQSGPQTGADVPNASVVSPPLFPLPTTSAFPTQPKEFPGIPWGSFLVFPEVSLAATYDDNIYAERPYVPTRSGVAHDVIYTLSPSIALKSKWTKHELNFDAGGDFDRYRTHDSEDVNDYWLGFDGRYDISPNTNIFGGARHSHDHEDRSTAGARDPAYQTEPTLYDHEEAHLGVAHAFGAYRLRLGGTYDRYNYKDSTSFLGTTIDNDYRDHDLSSLGLRLGYVLSPQYEIFGQVATDNRRYDNPINFQTFNRDSDGYRAAAGVRFTLQPQHLVGEAFAGVMNQNFDYSGFSDITKPYFGLQTVWKPSSLTTATLFIDRALEETTVFNIVDTVPTYASSSTDTTYGFEVERHLTSKLSVNGRAAYTHSDFNDINRLDKIIDAGAGLRYYVQPSVYLGADLRVTDRASNDITGQYSDNQVMVSVGYTPARNRDYSIIPEQEAGAPEAPRAQGLYSGFYLGAQLGYGALTTATSGPRGSGEGTDTADMGGFGASYGLFGGWGTEFANNWYLGVEVDGGNSSADWNHSKNKPDSVTEYVEQDSNYGLSLRAGYVLDGGLLYGKLGAVHTDFHTYFTENQYAATGAFDQKHSETGTRIGLGLEIPASRNLFVRTDYSVTRYDSYGAPHQVSDTGTIATESFKTSDAVFSLGLGWRFGNERPAVPTRPATELNGLYMGADLGHDTLGTKLTGTQLDSGGGPYDFTGDFAHSGFTGGVFAGYGYTYKQFYVGLEMDAEASNFGWYQERNTEGGGGRDFSAEKRGSYGGGLRLGYVLPNGSLLYGRIGAVQTRFNTMYNKGANLGAWINRTDTLPGTRFGLGAEIPASQNTFVRMDYSYTRYNDTVDFVTTQGGGANADAMRFDNTESLARLGLGYRF
jgi:outer membrane protein W